MAKRDAARDQDNVDANIVTRLHVARRQIFGCRGDARQAALADREVELGLGRAALDLDEGYQVALPCDQIDFADRRPHPPREDAPALEPQPPGGGSLTDP